MTFHQIHKFFLGNLPINKKQIYGKSKVEN